MKIYHILPVALLVSTCFFTACKPKDAELKTEVSEAIKNDDVDVSVKDGVVTLKGEVENPAAKSLAEAEARKVRDVQKVVNEIEVPLPPVPPAPPTPDELKNLADDKLNKEVQAVIAPFPEVHASVSNGVVTLSGEISKPGLALMMPRIAGLFPKKIENNLKVK